MYTQFSTGPDMSELKMSSPTGLIYGADVFVKCNMQKDISTFFQLISLVFVGGVEPSARREVWQYLFALYPCCSTKR